jgi:hypothetical protein
VSVVQPGGSRPPLRIPCLQRIMYNWQEVQLRQIDLHCKLTDQQIEQMGVPGVANC